MTSTDPKRKAQRNHSSNQKYLDKALVYKWKNKERLKDQNRKWLESLSEERKAKLKEYKLQYGRWYSQLPDVKARHLKRSKEYTKANPEKAAARQKRYREKNKEKIKARYHANTKIRDRQRAYANRPEVKERRNKNAIERRKNDPYFKVTHNLRSRIWSMLRPVGAKKSATTLNLLGCSLRFFKAWIELKMKPGMSWKNYGKNGWHVDHKRPCASFDLLSPEDQKKCFHYSNLQPLWWWENLSKADKWEEEAA